MSEPRKTALVTGSSDGIGRAIAHALARANFDVVVHYRTSRDKAQGTVAELEALGVRAVALQADLTRPEEAERLVLEAHQSFGGLGVLVNNVGNYVRKPLLETELSEWHDVLDSNLNAAFYTCRSSIPLMRVSGYGRIVNIGFAGAENLLARPNIVPYAIAKTGILILSRSLAKSEAAHGISVNVVAPGVIENSVSKPLSEIPVGRMGTLEEVADAVLYFVRSSEYITGQVLEVAGGFNL